MVSFFDKGPKMALRSPARGHLKAHKIETNRPRALKLGWVLERLFWPFVKKRDHLDPNFGKIISGNIFDHKEDNLGVFLSPKFRSLG